MTPTERKPARAVAAGLLALLLLAAWGNSFTGPWVFDDLPSLRDNPSLHRLATAFAPPGGGLTVSGRPLLNFSFALNYAAGGESVAGYHAVNLLIHFLAALTLAAVVRRTLQSPALAARYGSDAGWLALAVAALWAAHPLQTESVTYVVQRAESLAALFYLLTLYAFVRGTASPRRGRWFAAGAVSCVLGALTKETVATAPLLVLLYDRTFVSGSFRAAWHRHRGGYGALALSWLVLAGLLLSTADRGGTAGFATPVSAGQYALLQLHAVAHYLRLAVWPQPLVFDYGPFQAVPAGPMLIGAAVVGPLLLLTLWALWRRPAAGFAGAAFFGLLAPSSSVVPVASQIMAEHRMYLALAAVITLAALALHRWLGRRGWWVLLALIVAAGFRTAQRNADYHSNLSLWTATVRDCPSNPRARLNLGQALVEADQWTEAAGQYEAALALQPDYIAAHYDLGLVYLHLHRLSEAGVHFAAALERNPAMVEAAYNWGNTLAQAGRARDAVERYEYALRLDPAHARAHYNLGNTLAGLGRAAEAIPHYRESVRLVPDQADAHFNLGNALAESGRFAEAATEYETVLRLTPGDAEAARNLALVRPAAGGTPPR